MRWGLEGRRQRESKSSPGRNSETPQTALRPRTKAGLPGWAEGRWHSLG